MKRSNLLSKLLAFVSVLLLAACGAEAPSTSSESTPATGGQAAETQPADTTTNHLERIKQKGTLLVGTSADYPPYESVDQSGNIVGFDIDLIREVGKRMGVEVEVQDMAFDALIASLQEGKIDAIISAMQATAERDEQVDFSKPYHMPKDAFLIAPNSQAKISSPQDIATLNVGVQTGTAQERWVRANLVEPGLMGEDQLRSYERADQAALDLAAGRIDVLMIIADAARELAEQKSLTVALETEETIAAGQAIAIPEGAKELKAEIDRILLELHDENFVVKLQQQYEIP